MTDPQHTERDEHEDPFARIDPFVALMDGRRQLAEAIASHPTDNTAPGTSIAQQVAETLAIVAAHDEALTEVARAFAQGERNFEGVTTPRDRTLVVSDMDAAMLIRTALFEAVAAIADALDETVSTPWGGSDTWRMHLVALAMRDGAHAHALITGESIDDRDR
jgi:hypothetical protein